MSVRPGPPPSHGCQHLGDGWELAGTPAGDCPSAAALGDRTWLPAPVPGTVAAALGDDAGVDVDARDWWYRTSFSAGAAGPAEEAVLRFAGLATIAEVFLNGERVLDSDSMFAAHEVDVSHLVRGENELAICFRAFAPRLEGRRTPRARWRTRLVSEPNLRFHRTMLVGRAPGFAPGPPVVGPWREISLTRRRGLVVEEVRLRASVNSGDGVLRCRVRLRPVAGAPLPDHLDVWLRGPTGEHRGELRCAPRGDQAGTVVAGDVRVEAADLWWPHTHGTPNLYEVEIGTEEIILHRSRIGFRRLEPAADVAADGPDLRINGERIFARGAVWIPLSLSAPDADEDRLRSVLGRVAAAGLNMLRVAGIGAYESDAFYDLCDEIGILVWQDFMFANLDYPESDPVFMETVGREAREQLGRLGSRPSLAVLCGGSEVAQQVAMLGLDPGLAHGPLFGELLPAAVADADVDAPYVPSAPWGGDLPFRADRGVANYYGVGAYRRPLADARLAGVRFAAESLAFANVPDEEALEPLTPLAIGGAAWKEGVPRDVGAGWDFDDVRDHYLRELFGSDPAALRSVDPDRYLELSRAVSGEVMAETFGEWRRTMSPCHGALVLWLKDLLPGAGWGLLDHRGEPKVAYRHVARALAPVAVWSTDEGLNGIDVHVANDRPDVLTASLRVALYTRFEQLVEEASTEIEVAPHGAWEGNVETLLGRFVDVSWAYRFGPPAQDLVVLSLERDGVVLSQAFRYPSGRPTTVQPASRIGLTGRVRRGEVGAQLQVTSNVFAYGVRVHVPGYDPEDDAFGVEPGATRRVELRPVGEPSWPPAGATLTALNLTGRVRVASDDG